MKELLQTLTQTPGPCGYEDAVRLLVRREIELLVDDLRADALGNLIAHKAASKGSGRRIMLTAHMDEIGLIASHIDEHGFVRFANLDDGPAAGWVRGGRVRFLNGVPGVIQSDRPADETSSLHHLFIDVGAASRKECPVHSGDAGVLDSRFEDLGQFILGHALDNRAGVLVVIETLRALKSTPNELFFVFTVQARSGRKGAIAAAYNLEPEISISIDASLAADTPGGVRSGLALGQGPAIRIGDADMLADPAIVEWMARTAEKSRLPYQREVLTIGTTEAGSLQASRAGVLAGALCLPIRYIGSPSEMVSMDDLENTVRLLIALLKNPVRLDR